MTQGREGKIIIMPVTRIAVLKGFDRVILGRDIANNLQNGHVYEISEIMGVLMIRDLGEHALVERHSGHTISNLALAGVHCLTKAEYEKKLELQGEGIYPHTAED